MSSVFRFAPSPTGTLHIGHAYSALLNARLARVSGGKLLLRIEDTDISRCKREFETAIRDDLTWLGIRFDGPVRRQSDHVDTYEKAAERLKALGLLYPCFASRSQIATAVAERETKQSPWPRDPDGSPLYPGIWRDAPESKVAAMVASGAPHAWRLHMDRALKGVRESDLRFEEYRDEHVTQTQTRYRDPALWGDPVIVRKDMPASFHLAGVVDEYAQGITDVVRGADLAPAVGLHRLLQHHLDYKPPRYRHHHLVMGEDGEKLSKSRGSLALAELRASGKTPADIRAMAGFAD